MSRPLRLEGDSPQEIYDIVQRDYPEGTKIVSIERVTKPGAKFGIFASQHYEAVIQVPKAVRRRPRPDDTVRFDPQSLTGIAALLAEADEETLTPAAREPKLPSLTTTGREFNDLLTSLQSEIGEPRQAAEQAREPRPMAPGDLLVLVGLGEDALQAAPDVARSRGMLVACAGTVTASGAPHIDSPMDATEARAGGVRQGNATAVALGTDLAGRDLPRLLRDIQPEHVWAVVNASRKPEDTERWVGRLRELTDVQAMVVVGADLTDTPETVDRLGLPTIEVDTDDGTAR